jgi:hypothetical protein
MTMRALNLSLGGLKLEANFDLRVGESIDFVILANGTKIRCSGKILAIEELENKVCARLCFAPPSGPKNRELSNYLHTLYWKRYEKWVIGVILVLSTYIAYLIIRT